ncbi:hypothetical protein DEV92_11738 [Phyllobacterium myrsinacearum]|uniref:Alpha/beta hydrolase n=1 Tax=Phyllobacterium myrsinacearum TaxID=28101 RepID=A0A2S9JFL4_9HYPH|nr:alpha/beta hydrolase [Phyllobacterium myrsinacearum]PWV86281.1 hypothetical protein DEV92_11738 [Phyllobacterium myrsinacearum]RZV00006.1 hypothetical protein EV654_4142 [Phyllobacterium myrsinacearum]
MNKEIHRQSGEFADAVRIGGRAAAQPVVFNQTIGLFQRADTDHSGNTAVLFASPWGLEELCTRKFWRIIAEQLAEKGIPSFRFDWPGTGDALDGGDFSKGLAVWSDALVAGAALLKDLSGCQRVIVLSQGLGCVIAADAAGHIGGLDAIAFMAPVVSGRHYTRELSIWSGMVDADLGLPEAQRDKTGVSIASLKLPAEVAEGLRRANLMTLGSKIAPECLVLARVDRPSDREFAAHLSQLGIDTILEDYTSYDKLVSNPVISQLPLAVAGRIADWAAGVAGRIASPEVHAPAIRDVKPGTLQGDDFCETPLRFGRGDRLYGVLCEPQGARRGATVLFLTSAYDRHAGWGRTIVTIARALARRGVASLRFDTANASDSPPVPGVPDQVLYHDAQNADVAEALSFLNGLGTPAIIAAGRCSGAYLGFQSAVADPRLSGAVLVNPITFYWEPGRSVDEAVREGSRTLEEYGSRLLRASTFKRLVRGELDFAGIARNVAGGMGRRIAKRARHLLRGRTTEGRAVYKAFGVLKDRQIPVELLYSYRDPGLEYFGYYFDAREDRIAGYPNVSVKKIPDADHNLTPQHARTIYIDALERMALRFQG